MKTTIIVPTYNLEDIVLETLESIRVSILNTGAESKYEVKIFDDKSNDNTVGVIKKYIKENNLKGTVSINKKNMGGGFTKNEAIKSVKTEGFFILDGDDIMEPGFLNKVSSHQIDDYDVLRVKYKSTAPGDINKVTGRGGGNSKRFDGIYSMQISTYVIRTSFGFDKQICGKFTKYDDYALNVDIYRSLNENRYIKLNDVYSMKWRVYQGSISNARGGDFSLYLNRSVNYIYKCFNETGDEKLAFMYLDVCASHYYNILENPKRGKIGKREGLKTISKLMKDKKIRKYANKVCSPLQRIRFFVFRNNLRFFIKPI